MVSVVTSTGATQGAWLATADHHARFFVDFVGDAHPRCRSKWRATKKHHTVELVAVLTQAACQGLFTVGLNIGGYKLHVGVSTNRRSSSLQAVLT